MYWFNSNNGDWIRKDESGFLLVYRAFLKSKILELNVRKINESEFNFISKKFGFLPVKLKKVPKKKLRMYKSNYTPIYYPSKEEIRDDLLNQLLNQSKADFNEL